MHSSCSTSTRNSRFWSKGRGQIVHLWECPSRKFVSRRTWLILIDFLVGRCGNGNGQYVVSSASLASVNRPLLRLELAVTTPTLKVESVPYFRRESLEENAEIAVAEYSKTELDKLIFEMETISQALESTQSSY